MRKYQIHHIDSFTNILFGGNPTVTVLNADTLTDEEMQKIAREMNLSETGFLLASQRGDFRLRFFTPTREIQFCGHATIGALCSIAREGLFGCHLSPRTRFAVETKVGILPMEINLTEPHSPKFIFDLPPIELVLAPYTVEDLASALQVPTHLFDLTKPVMLDKTQRYLYFAVSNLESLKHFYPDMRQATEFAKKDGIVVFGALTGETFDSQNQLHARGFAPLFGVPEDPFTGSMQGGLAAYAMRNGILDPALKWVGSEQGHLMGRPGFAKLEIVSQTPFQVRLHAEAVHVFASELTLP